MRPVWMRRSSAPALAGEAAHAVDGAVDDVLVDGVVDGGEEARQPAGEVHQPVDDVLVEPGEEGGQEERRPDHQRVVGLVHVVLVVDHRPDAEEAVLEVVRHAALAVLEELHGEEPADGGRGHAHALEEPLGGVAEVQEGHLGGQHRLQPVLQDGLVPGPEERDAEEGDGSTAPKASVASTQVIERRATRAARRRGGRGRRAPWPAAWAACRRGVAVAAWSSWPWAARGRRGPRERGAGPRGPSAGPRRAPRRDPRRPGTRR